MFSNLTFKQRLPPIQGQCYFLLNFFDNKDLMISTWYYHSRGNYSKKCLRPILHFSDSKIINASSLYIWKANRPNIKLCVMLVCFLLRCLHISVLWLSGSESMVLWKIGMHCHHQAHKGIGWVKSTLFGAVYLFQVKIFNVFQWQYFSLWLNREEWKRLRRTTPRISQSPLKGLTVICLKSFLQYLQQPARFLPSKVLRYVYACK